MERIESRFEGVKVFSLPSVDHPEWGKHIELGVKGEQALAEVAFGELKAALQASGAPLGPELVR
jgi:hypothetical protein